MLRRGAFIVLEGCDRVGKTTHAKLLSEALKEDGQKVEMMQFPDRSTLIGGVINKYLEGSEEIEDHAVHLLFSANRWEQVPKMVKLLNSGVNLIVDRYAYSGVAFSYAKKGLNFSWCKQSDVGLPKPDLVLFLDLPAGSSAERTGFGEERYENVEFQTEVKKIYGLLQEDNWKIVNTDRPQEEVHQDLKTYVQEAIDNVSSPACETLWTDNYETYV